MTQVEKAKYFKSLHVAGTPLVLYNIWDAGGAKTLADAGAVACATGSWSVAAAHGFDDGETIPLDFVLQIVERIAQSVDLSLSVDFEGGYATDPDDITTNARRVITAGAVGVNFEDQVVKGAGLYASDIQATRIAAVRRAADLENMPLFINARTDLFLKSDSADHAGLVDDAIERAAAYTRAGADGFFIPSLTHPDLIERICRDVAVPVNVMMTGDLTSITDVAALGVARASYGPNPYFKAMSDLTARFNAIS